MKMVRNAKREIDLVLSRVQLMQFVCTYAEELKKATKRLVEIRIISEAPEQEDSIPRIIEEQISPSGSIELRYIDNHTSHYVVSDLKVALIMTIEEDNLLESPCLWTTCSSLLKLLKRDFKVARQQSVSWREIETSTAAKKPYYSIADEYRRAMNT
jgi:hypothetical protein